MKTVISVRDFCGGGSARRRRRCRARGRSWRNNYYEMFWYYQSVISVSLCFTLIFISNLAVSGDTTSTSTGTGMGGFLASAAGTPSSSSSPPTVTPERSSISASDSLITSHGASSLEDHLRKEMIKVQILQRLGLTEKPVVDQAHKISRDLVLETLRRTETLDEVYDGTGGGSGGGGGPLLTTSRFQRRNNSSTSAAASEDLSYAKTSEIISFPEKGPDYNGETLLSFSFAGTNAFGVGVRVKKAHLWVKMDHRSPIGKQLPHLFNPRGVTLYIFQVQGNFTNQSKLPAFVRTQDIELELVASKTVALGALGWQKLDVTSVVQNWYSKISRHKIRHGHGASVAEEPSKNKLTLLVDCSGCGYTIHPITFTRQLSSSSTGTTSSGGANETDADNSSNSNSMNRSTSYLQNEVEQQPRHALRNSSHGHGHSHHHHHHHHTKATAPVTHTSAADAFESFTEEHLDNRESSPSDDHLDNLSEIPFLVLETETVSPSIKRSRRRALECSPRVKQCCKQRFFISFAELGWQDWIIAPRGYYANYCRGHCGGVHRTPDTFLNYHTHVMEEYRRTAAGEVELNGITPCCAPTKFAAMSLIYFGPELNIIKRDLPKMIIEECGCP